MDMFALITLESSQGVSCTVDAVFTVSVPTTRQELYRALLAKVAEEYGHRFAGAKVIYYSVEPNSIGA